MPSLTSTASTGIGGISLGSETLSSFAGAVSFESVRSMTIWPARILRTVVMSSQNVRNVVHRFFRLIPSRRAESLPVSAEKRVKPNGRRRSPRLARVVEVEISGRGADGKVLVESTSTCDISRHGASLTARTPFPRSAPLAIRRSGGKPALARVVSVKSCSQPGLQQLGVGFVEDESYWEHEFPSDWQDNDGPAVEDEKPAEEPTAPAAEATRAQEERAGASLVQQAAGTEEKHSMTSIFSPWSSFTMFCIRTPRSPTQEPTGSTPSCLALTATLLREPGSLAMASISTAPL